MIDVHCHLNFQAFENDFTDVIKRAETAGVTKIINTGTQLSSSRCAVDLAEKFDNLYAIAGIHPHHADKVTASDSETPRHSQRSEESQKKIHNNAGNNEWITQLAKIAQHPKVIGIGEIGLDYFNYKSNGIVDPQIQKEVFLRQIEVAHKLKLPLQIHNRLAGEDVIALLKTHKNLLQDPPGMFHCFAGTKEVLRDALHLGFFIGFDGNITYKGLAPGETVDVRELAKYTPLDRIVLETDSPYLTPVPYRGQRNEPTYGIIIAQFIAGLKDISFEKLVEQTDKNVYTVFKRL